MQGSFMYILGNIIFIILCVMFSSRKYMMPALIIKKLNHLYIFQML